MARVLIGTRTQTLIITGRRLPPSEPALKGGAEPAEPGRPCPARRQAPHHLFTAAHGIPLAVTLPG